MSHRLFPHTPAPKGRVNKILKRFTARSLLNSDDIITVIDLHVLQSTSEATQASTLDQLQLV